MEDLLGRDLLSGAIALAGIYLIFQGNIPFGLLLLGLSRLNYYQKGWNK